MTSIDGENDIERGVYQTPSNDDDFYDDYDDEDGIGRGPVIAIFFVILMAAFVGVVWLSYNMGKAAGVRTQPPVIHASNLPFKSEPDEAGGLEEPVESPSVAALSGNGLDEDVSIEPSAEQPIDRPRETAANETAANETTPSVPTPSASMTLSEPDTSASDTSSTATQPQVEVTPREVPAEEATQSAAVSPSRPATDTNGQLIVPRPSSRVRNAAAGEALSQEQAARIAAQNSARPATTTPATTTTQPATTTTQPATTTTTRPAQTATQGPPSLGTTAVQPSASQSAAAGNFVVQVASFPEIADADAAWQRLRSRHEAIVGNAVQDVQTADLGERGTWYRLRIGYYETRADANDVCTQLQASGQDCLVVSR